MSVTVTIHFPVSDVAKAIEGLHGNAQFLEEITESTRGAGMLHHRFVSGDGELMSSTNGRPPSNSKASSTETQGRRRHGFYRMTGPPEITVFGSIDAPGTV